MFGKRAKKVQAPLAPVDPTSSIAYALGARALGFTGLEHANGSHQVFCALSRSTCICSPLRGSLLLSYRWVPRPQTWIDIVRGHAFYQGTYVDFNVGLQFCQRFSLDELEGLLRDVQKQHSYYTSWKGSYEMFKNNIATIRALPGLFHRFNRRSRTNTLHLPMVRIIQSSSGQLTMLQTYTES